MDISPFLFQNFVAFVMIWVRWAIPDMSGSLRDKIRREAYITNEIIIKQEAERARLALNGMNGYKLSNILIYFFNPFNIVASFLFCLERLSSESPESPTDTLRIEQLMANNLSSSQLDLVMHGDGNPFAPGHVKPRNYDSKLHKSDSKYSEMFLETEKNGGAIKRKGAQNSPCQINVKDYDEPTTETSSM